MENDRKYIKQESLKREEQDFPIAFARAVYEDYNFLETELAATYQPQNFYCYAIDKKREWNIYWGHNMSFSHLECMKALTKDGQKWKYLVLQQNYDASTKTNEELVQIYKWMQGANDVQVRMMDSTRIDFVNKKWTFDALNLFRNMNDLNVTQMILQLEDATSAVDEIFTQTLQATDALDAPGGFTHFCLDLGISVHHWTRFHLWGLPQCHSKLQMHYLCVFGIEDLVSYFNDTKTLFNYKMASTMDFGAVDCWHETLYNRTHFDRGTHRLQNSTYLNHPLVRYHVEKVKSGFVDFSKFDCITGNAPALL
ncbi:core-2/I-Branching enzyme domain-containing protein [Ditylenchus destructor]|nr:core-2/I-Branching enzyme domain-containing protein [Ditylenchus destructor]